MKQRLTEAAREWERHMFIAAIGLCAFMTMMLLAVGVGRALSAPRARLRARVESVAHGGRAPARNASQRRLLRMQNYSAVPLLRRLLQHSSRAERIADDLDRAGISLRVGEYLTARAALGLVLALCVLSTFPPTGLRLPAAIFAGFVGWRVPAWLLRLRLRRCQAQIEAHLPEALDLIARALRAGGSLLAAIEQVIEHVPGALADQFRRTSQEIATGQSVEAAFEDLDRRVASKDLHIVVTAILVQREVGGNLAEILSTVAMTMRERSRLRGELNAMISRQRLSAWVIGAVPLVVLATLMMMAGDTVRPLFDSHGGRLVLGFAAALELAGFLMMYRLASSFEV